MAQESRLGITIDSRGAEQNANRMADSLDRMEKSGDAAAASADGVSSSAAQQKKELAQLLGQINPTVSALGRLDEMQEKLAKFKKAGIVESDTFVEYTDRINVMRGALGETSEGMNKAGMSAKAYSAALRGVPAQFTDIAVSLQGGQAPLTVLLQQGGQLKDMFGGIGPAAKALGGYILGLVNPFTVAAAAAAALALAYYKGSEQSDALRNSLIMTGKFSKASEAQMIALASAVDGVTGTFGDAVGALTQLTEAGVNTNANFKLISTTAVDMQRITGKAIQDTVAEFVKIGKDPVKGVIELDEKYRFLTASVYAQIKALAEQGNTIGAVDLAERTYAEAMGQRTETIRQNLGVIERGWLNIKDVVSEVFDAFASIGRKSAESENRAVTEIQQKIAYLRSTLDTAYEDNDARARIASLEAELKKRQDIQKTNEDTLEQERKRRELEVAGRQSVDSLSAAYKSTLDQTEKLNESIKSLDKDRQKAIDAGVFGEKQQTEYTKARASYEKQIEDIRNRGTKKTPAGKAPRENNSGVAEAQNTFAKLYSEYDPAAQAARALTKEQTQLQLVLDKGKISQEEYGKALAQASTNYAAAIKGAQVLTQAEQYRAQLEKQLSTQRTQYSLEAAGVGMGDQQSQRLQQRVQLEQQTNDRILQLRTELANATTEKQRQDLQAQIDLTNEYLPLQIEAMQAGWAQMDQAMLNPINGWTAAVQNFGTQAMNIAGQTQSIFSAAFSTISTDITSAIMSGTLSFSTLGDIGKNVLREIIAGFVKMGVQMVVNAALSATLGAASTAATAALAGTTAAAWAPAAALASLASFGGNSVPAAAALTSTTALASTLAVIPGFATGGYFTGAGTAKSDSNLARISDGEFIVNAAATARNRGLLESINAGESMPTRSSSSSAGTDSSQISVAVHIHEDASKAGRSESRREGNQVDVDVWVANVMSDGSAHQALSEKYGLSTVGS
ncbi:phage tail length tape measure family protein [Pseudomonas poae]|uniref:Tail length tape measure protein n=1 Tax=Pseudomonas poae TaxID=200451 RepID=A0A2S9EUP1_9PSED|nr:phage tail length tape measure family protein [Pseudomonas poae]PRA33811.1 tail length tape measure protein [Pseudomonas poae]PRC19599.1 tail length tape measure protein [Pseudomonas poae]